MIYIGNTKQLVKNRFSKHKSDINLQKNKETTGLTLHSIEKKHKFNFEEFKVLEHIPNYFQRNTAEKMHIARNTNTINLKEDTAGLHESYNNIFKNHRPPNHNPEQRNKNMNTRTISTN